MKNAAFTALDAELAEIRALAWSWLYAVDIAHEYLGLAPVAAGRYWIEGYVKADGIAADATPGNEPARKLRAALLSRAEDGIGTLAAAGWQLTDGVYMEFTGGLAEQFLQTLAGELARESEQRGISLRVKLQVNRPRS